MKKIIFATGNANKMVEIRQILSDLGMEILSQREAGIEADPEENGSTFEENALIKARAVRRIAAGMEENRDAIVLADDSGLEIDYLNKEPGIYSARYMGTDTSYDIKNSALLERLEESPMSSGPPGLCAPSRRSSRTGRRKWCGAPWKAASVMRSSGKTASAMIPSSFCPSTAAPAHSFRRRRRTLSATEARD